MKRLCVVFLGFAALPALTAAQDETGRKQTVAYLQKLQQVDGSFKPGVTGKVDLPPSLKATSSAIRALRYFGGQVPNKEACAKFVASCFDAESGGFADTPKGKPDVFTTAVGLMAVVELKMPMEKLKSPAVKYLAAHAKSFDDIRIAVAGLEAVKEQSSAANAWLAEVLEGQNDHGIFGKGLGQARETGSRIVALLRLDGKLGERDAVLKALKSGQRLNGGWGKADSELASDLETTYRVMRCFHMLKAMPDSVEGVRSFVAKCRNEDGGYAVAPGDGSSVSGTYFAGIILHWLGEEK